MTTAADPTNTIRAPDILAARAAPRPTAAGNGPDLNGVWDSEGGHLVEARAHRRVNGHPITILRGGEPVVGPLQMPG
jgi:hypothetical protein